MHPVTNTEIPIITGIHQLEMTGEKDPDTSVTGNYSLPWKRQM